MKTLAAILVLTGAAMPAYAQGMSYDMKTTADMTDPRTGTASTRVFSAGHGQFADGNARIDFTESMMPGGMMGAGSYMILRKGSPVSTFVNPAKHEYLEMNRDELTADAAAAQKAMGGIAKTEMTGITVDVKEMGAGETIEGNPTIKYHVTTDFTMKITMMGHTTSSASHSTTDLWIAPGLDPMMNPVGRQATSPGGMTSALMEATTKAYAKMKSGLVLKAVTTNESEAGAKKRSSVMTMTVSNLKKARIDPSVFVVPAGYAKSEGIAGAMGAMFGDSLAAARARAKGKPARP